MDNSIYRAQRKGNIYFGLGWLLTIVNLAGIAWAIWLPILLHNMPEDIFFTLDDGVSFSMWGCIGLAAFAIFSVLQTLFLPRLAHKMVADIPETAAAEASLRIARYLAFLTFVACVASLFMCVKTYRTWTDIRSSGLA